MVYLFNKTSFVLLLALFFSSCLTDVEESIELRTLNIENLDSLVKNIDFTLYDTIPYFKDKEFPIVGWRGIQSQNFTFERFIELRNSGINLVLVGFANVDSVHKALDIAEQVGVKIIIRTPELYTHTEQTVKRFMNHPANAGYYLQDEPTLEDLGRLSSLSKTIEAIDNTRFTFVNLQPDFGVSDKYKAENYKQYIQQYIYEIPLKILSFDFYPIVNNYIRSNWYNNLEMIKDEAYKASIPFWAFALTSEHWDYPKPTIEHLRLQVYSNLAYGATGIQYFTYWIPIEKEMFTSAPIDREGNKTEEYYILQQMNKEIQNYSSVFLTSKVKKVGHYGNIPHGTSKLSSLPDFVNSLKIYGGNALVSELENDNYSFFMIQNTNLFHEIGINIKTNNKTQIILKNGSIIPVSLIKEEFKLSPGDMVLFMS
ncbi:MAG: hypothetical protein PHE29_07085 [Tissierellia bacterium]|nr:hypothetical protein [Tissierellia bacterium]MDD4781482.1 hypothetical protein [Tissierellia bacterium]